MNTPVSFEVAKMLKEKRYNKLTLLHYFEDGELRQNTVTLQSGYYEGGEAFAYNDLLEYYNNAWVTKKNGDRCYGCDKSRGYFETFSAPTVSEALMWLYEKHGVWIWVQPFKDHAADVNDPYYAQMNVWKKGVTASREYGSPTEAYEAAIEYALQNLI